MRKLVLCIFLSFSALVQPDLDGATLHAIIVGHTQDEDCGDAITVSVSKMHEECVRIAHYADLDLKETILTDTDYDPFLVLKTIKDLKTEPDDVVLYYHNSHGFRTAASKDPWPSTNFPLQRKSIRIGYIASLLAAKSQRLTLTLVDACNRPLKRGYPPVYARYTNRAQQMLEGYRHLFRESAGCIIACSAKPGQAACCSSTCGAWFTNEWIKAIKDCSFTQKPNWCDVMEHAARKTIAKVQSYEGEEIQEPCYETDMK